MANNTSGSNYDLYKVFYYVAWRKSLTKAAGDLGISQPAVSQSLKQLESHLGVKLTQRCPHGIALTEEGKKLFPYVKKGCDAFNKAEALFNIDNNNSNNTSGKSDKTTQAYDCFISGTQYCHFAGQKLPYRILEHLPLVLPKKDDPCRIALDDFLVKNSIKVKPVNEQSGYNAIISDTIRNIGIGFVPYGFAKPYIESKEVYLLEFESEIPPRTLNS